MPGMMLLGTRTRQNQGGINPDNMSYEVRISFIHFT